jgi:hypothetical protein
VMDARGAVPCCAVLCGAVRCGAVLAYPHAMPSTVAVRRTRVSTVHTDG